MKLGIVGASPAFPNPGSACSSYLIETSEITLVVDCGHGSVGTLRSMTDPAELTAIVISHMHPDHFFDLVPLKYLYQLEIEMERRVPLYLPPGGLQTLKAVHDAVGMENGFETVFSLSEYNPESGLRIGDLELKFFPTQHFVSAYAVRLVPSEGGRQLFFSSDTGWSDSLVEFATGASVGLVEATLAHLPPEKRQSGHLTPRQAGLFGSAAGFEHLILTHYPRSAAERVRGDAASAFEQCIDLAEPGQIYDI